MLELAETLIGDGRPGWLAHSVADPASAPETWHALWTNSHCERRVHDQLMEKGFRVFLPRVESWSRRRGVRRRVQTPMFPGYLFLVLHQALDKAAYLEIAKVSGLVRVLGESWDRLAVIPAEEMRAIQTVITARQPVLPFPYLKEGQRARIAGGPLTGIEGILVERKPHQGLLVLSVHLLQRSVAVIVDGTEVEPTT